MKIALTGIACALGLVGMVGQVANAETPTPPARHMVCIDPSRISHLSYPDDHTILFHMDGGKVRIWRNDLARTCPGLKFEQGIAWNIWGNEVCSNMQVFQVLRRGTPCALGDFTPYTPPEKKTGE